MTLLTDCTESAMKTIAAAGSSETIEIEGEPYAAVIVDEGTSDTLGLPGYSGEADLRVLMPTSVFFGSIPKSKTRFKWVARDEWYQIERPRRALGDAFVIFECSLANRSEG